MDIHGLVKDMKWEVIGTSTETSASIKLKVNSNAKTLESFPFEFEVVFTYTLIGSTLRIQETYINTSREPLPMYDGFHPYFRVSDKSQVEYIIDASKVLHYEDNIIADYTSKYDLTNSDKSIVILDAKGSTLSFKDKITNKAVKLSYSDEFKYIVLWSDKENNSICPEPWMALPNALNSKKDLYYIEPDKSYEAFLEISLIG